MPWDESKHPRKPKGTEAGGEFTSDLEHYLEAVLTMREMHGQNKQGSFEQIMLAHGRDWKFDKGSFCGGKAHQCYRNAFVAALNDPKLTYVEGYVATFGVPIQHAWTVDKQGKVHDYTLKDGKNIDGYFGVPFKKQWLNKFLLQTKTYGVFDWMKAKEVLDADPKDYVDTSFNKSASGKTLYVRRDLLNGEELAAWAKKNGFKTTLPAEDMHVTVLYSKEPVDWSKMGKPNAKGLRVKAGRREVERLGEKKDAVVLLFESPRLTARHKAMRALGASSDFEGYKSHVTLSWDAPDIEEGKVVPFDGTLVFGPEIYEEIDEDWKDNLAEKAKLVKYSPKQPRAPKGVPEGGQWVDGYLSFPDDSAYGDYYDYYRSNPLSRFAENLSEASLKRPLTKAQRDWLLEYIDGDLMGNNFLRTVDVGDSIFNKVSLKEPLVVYRGVDNNAWKALKSKLRRGKTFTDNAFVSSSLRKEIAEEFGYGHMLEIRLPKGSKALPLGRLNSRELEVLIKRGSKFKVRRVTPKSATLDLVDIAKYSPNQPRAPKGDEDGGQWVSYDDGGGTSGLDGPEASSDKINELHTAAGLTLTENRALQEYTRDPAGINYLLRNGIGLSAQNRKLLRKIDAIMAKTTLPENLIVYRGVSEEAWETLKSHLNGGAVTDPGLMSTTLRKKAAFDFAKDGAILEIKVPAGTSGVALAGDATVYDDETEILLNRGTKLKLGSMQMRLARYGEHLGVERRFIQAEVVTN